jgi:hypothetical protein
VTDAAFIRFVLDLRASFPSKPWADTDSRYWPDLRRAVEALHLGEGELDRAFGRLILADWFPDSLGATLRLLVDLLRAEDRAGAPGGSLEPDPENKAIDAHWLHLSFDQQAEWYAYFDRERPQWLRRFQAGWKMAGKVRDANVRVLAYAAEQGKDLTEHLGPEEGSARGNLFREPQGATP